MKPDPIPVTGIAAAGRVKMRWCRFGRGAKTLVILPGLSVTRVTDMATTVAQHFEAFTDRFTVYLFDVEEDIPEGCTVPRLAEDTYTVLRAMGLGDIYLFGASMGGAESICLAADHPELVKRLALASVPVRADETVTAAVRGWIAEAGTGDGTALLRQMAGSVYSEAAQKTYGEALYAAGEALTGADLDRFIRTASAILSLDVTARAAAVTAPTLLVSAEGDILIGEALYDTLAACLPDAEKCRYDTSYGHAVYDEAPDLHDRLLAFFLQA